MIHSILQILAFQVLFLAVYDLFLKKETFFGLNRIYLLFTPILGFILPFLSFSYIQESIPQEYIFQLPAVIIDADSSETVSSATPFWFTGLFSLWCLGVAISTLYFGWKLFKIAKLKSLGISKNTKDYKLVILPKTDLAFSFYKTMYVGEDISEENRANIIAHEKIHIQQRHTLDLLFFEVLRIIFWFNPIVYAFQNRIATLHEFIADAKVVAKNDKKQYYQNLLSEVFQTENISFINPFFNQSLTRLTILGRTFAFGTPLGEVKKRILMLQKSKSTKTAQFKYLLLLPIICGMLVYTACSDEPKAEEVQTTQESDSEVMNKINELAEAIMKKGDMTQEEEKALKLLTTESEPGDKVYTSVQEYLDESKDQNGADVPFAAVEKVPVYPGCSGADNEAMKSCMSLNISNFVNSNFNTGIADNLKISGRQRISVQFKIDKTGKTVDVQAKSLSHSKELESEAIRVVELLPQMQPGEQKGEKVSVLYSLPIVFDIVE